MTIVAMLNKARLKYLQKHSDDQRCICEESVSHTFCPNFMITFTEEEIENNPESAVLTII